METMKREVAAQEWCVQEHSSSTLHVSMGGREGHDGGRGGSRKNTRTLQQRNQETLCIFCERPHQSKLCQTVPTVSARKAIIRRCRRCFICLKMNHTAKDCTSTALCPVCNGRHHEAVCNQAQAQHATEGGEEGVNEGNPNGDGGSIPISTSVSIVEYPTAAGGIENSREEVSLAMASGDVLSIQPSNPTINSGPQWA